MSDEPNDNGQPNDDGAGKPAEPPKGDGSITQEQLNSLLADQKRKLTAKYADYGDLKAKADAHDAALEAAKSDADKAIDAARKDGETAAMERANGRLVAAEAKALAAQAKFRNPATAVRLLDLAGVNVDTDGTVDAKAIEDRLKELAEAEPYLLDDGKRPAPKPDPGQGGSAPKKSSLVGLSGDDLYDRLHPKKTA